MNTTLLLHIVMSLPRVGAKTTRALLPFLGHVEEMDGLHDVLTRAKTQVKRLPVFEAGDIDRAIDQAYDQIAGLEANGVMCLNFLNGPYPHRLRTLTDAPMLLYALGDVSALEAERCLAIVGTREPSNYGISAAQSLSAYCADQKITVVSGLAIGCDIEAHRAVLEHGGKTVAVMAHGLHTIQPKRHERDAERIISLGGCIITEYPLGVDPRPPQYVARNRLQSGLSDALLVIETGIVGGTMHTARFAEEQNRPIGVVPVPNHMIGDDRVAGNQALIRRGALPISGYKGVESLFNTLPIQKPQGNLFSQEK
jgi:DNA processing protein